MNNIKITDQQKAKNKLEDLLDYLEHITEDINMDESHTSKENLRLIINETEKKVRDILAYTKHSMNDE